MNFVAERHLKRENWGILKLRGFSPFPFKWILYGGTLRGENISGRLSQSMTWCQLHQLSGDRVIVTLLTVTCFQISGWQVYLPLSSFEAASVTLATSARAVGREVDATAAGQQRWEENFSLK